MKQLNKIIVVVVVAIAFGSIGYIAGTCVSNKSHSKQLSAIRKAWYNASIETENFCAKLYAEGYLLEEDHNNPTVASLWAQGILVGTSYTLESMNQVAIAFGEDPIVLSDINTIRQRIENIATSMIRDGEVSEKQN